MNDEYVKGLNDIEGTFSGILSDDIIGLAASHDVRMMYFYGPDPKVAGSWWRHLYHRAREILFLEPYPMVVTYSGPVTMTFDEPYEAPDGSTIVSGSFTRAGEWKIDE